MDERCVNAGVFGLVEGLLAACLRLACGLLADPGGRLLRGSSAAARRAGGQDELAALAAG